LIIKFKILVNFDYHDKSRIYLIIESFI